MEVFGIIVLHYKTVEKTIQCVDSLLCLGESDKSVIVIVDNGSNDGTKEKLCIQYKKINNVYVIGNDENLGFSQGNNTGYSFLNSRFLDLEYIIDINNDIIIRQKDFLKKLTLLYNKYKFAVAGPDIFTPSEKKHYNPLPYIELNPEKIEERIRDEKKKAISSRLPFIKEVVRKSFGKICRVLFGEFFMNRNGRRYAEGVPIHGSALIFSKDYIEKYKIAFYPEPFLFREEDILFAKCKHDDMKMVYLPQLTVIHEHSSSRKVDNDKAYQRYRFTQNEYAKADMIYCDFLKRISNKTEM